MSKSSPLGFLVVTSLVVGFLGYTLELFCTVCNLLVIVNRVNYFYVYTCCLDRIVVASEANCDLPAIVMA